MPNTLFHLAVQIPLFARFLRPGEIHFALLGAIIPDLPWVAQRLAGPLPVDSLDLRAYFVIQSSLVLSLTLSGAIASCCKQSLRAFAWLSIGCLCHLILDAVQVKFANGALLLAPFDWRLWNWAWLPPEHWLFTLGSIAALGVLVYYRRQWQATLPTLSRSGPKFLGALLLLLIYFGLPAVWLEHAFESNHHFIGTLQRAPTLVTSEPLEMDRARYTPLPTPHIQTGTGQVFAVSGLEALQQAATVSASGILHPKQQFIVTRYVQHTDGWRDALSIVGLACLLCIWLLVVIKSMRTH